MYKADFIKEKEEYGVCVLRKKCYKYTKMYLSRWQNNEQFFFFFVLSLFPRISKWIYLYT